MKLTPLTIAAAGLIVGLLAPAAAHAAPTSGARAPAATTGPATLVLVEGPATPADVATVRAALAANGDLVSPATTEGWTTKTLSLHWCWGYTAPRLGGHDGLRCLALGAWVDVQVIYDGLKVYQRKVSCNHQGFYSITVQWCHYTGDGTASLSAGMNFRTNLGIGSVKASLPFWMRVWVTSKGEVTTGGGHL